MADPLDIPKYRNAPHAAYTIIKEEGVRALYKGVTLTALRQGIVHRYSISSIIEANILYIATNQAANFTAYQEMKKYVQKAQGLTELPSYQHLILGGVSGAMGNIYLIVFH
jgi:solute carrier family 25 citrate transporter 1